MERKSLIALHFWTVLNHEVLRKGAIQQYYYCLLPTIHFLLLICMRNKTELGLCMLGGKKYYNTLIIMASKFFEFCNLKVYHSVIMYAQK